MAKQISLVAAAILSCLLTVQAEPSVTSYSLTGDNGNYDYSNGLSTAGYLGAKDSQRGSDFYNGASSGHSLIPSGNQVNSGESTTASSYGGFTPSSQNTAFGGYAAATRDNLKTTYSSNSHGSYRGFAGNGDSTFEGYATGLNTPGSEISQYSTNSKSPSYGYTEPLSTGTNAATSYAESENSFRSYAGNSRNPSFGGYLDNDQRIAGDTSFAFNSAVSEHSFGKPKDVVFGAGHGHKYMNDVYPSPSDMRYFRGSYTNLPASHNHGSPMYLNSESNSPYPGIRGAPIIYGSGKANKYSNKYPAEYNAQGVSFPSREHEPDYLHDYSKSGNKIIIIKDGRPSSQSYSGVSSYLGKIMGAQSYKSKLGGAMSYPGANAAHAMSSLHASFGNNYGDSHLPRGYRSSGYSPGRGSIYSGYA